MDVNENTLRSDVATLDEGDPNLAALLCDLAQLQLDKGEVQEAQELFQRAYELRKAELSTSAIQQPENEAEAAPRAQGSSAAATWPSSSTAPLESIADGGGTGPPGLGPISARASGAAADAAGDAAANSVRATSHAAASSSGVASREKDGDGSDDWETGGEWSTGLTKLKAAEEFAAATTPSPAKPVIRGRGAAKASTANRVEPEWRATASVGTRNLTHIIEIYELTRAVRSEDLERFLADFAYIGTTPNLRWVDDEHALAVFPNEDAAQLLLDSKQWKYKVRPYIDASMGSLLVPEEELAPPKTVRPKTTATVARRLIGHALGDTRVRDKEGEKELAQLRRDKKEQRKLKAKATAAVWDGD